MKTLRREIHPIVRVLDSKQGIVEYVASNETLDCHNEIVRADGWRFNRFKKNAPFVDSHNYESIQAVLGQVIDFSVQGKKLVETVKWAIDVGENLLANWGFNMTQAGYLKAVSVGFMPVTYCSRWDNDKSVYNQQCSDLGLSRDVMPDVIYMEQEQIELSACVIGANPDALAKSYQSGILTDTIAGRLAKQFPALAEKFERAKSSDNRSYSFPAASSRSDFAGKFEVLTNKSTTPPALKIMKKDTKELPSFDRMTLVGRSAIERIESARRSGSDSEINLAVRLASTAMSRERHFAYGNPIVRYLNENPERRYLWNALARWIGTDKLSTETPEHKALSQAILKDVSGINLQDQFGAGLLLALPVGEDIFDLLLHYGQYKYLGLRPMSGAYTNYAKVTGYPKAVFITPTQQGKTTIPEDTSLAGNLNFAAANTIATLVTLSLAWLQDVRVDLSEVFLTKVIMALAARIDYGAYRGNGQDDQDNGMTTGIFMDADAKSYQAHKAGIADLERVDFINTVQMGNAAALQRMDEQPPRWYISPLFIAQLLQLWDGQAKNYLLKTPAQTGGEWELVGFPVTWASQAPSAVVAGSKVAMFGNPDSYLVALQENFEITKSEGKGFASANVPYRALGRGRSVMREATGFVGLTLAGA